MATYNTSTGLRALEGSNPISDVDAGFLALAQDVAALVAAVVPVGSLFATARSSAPTGFLLCDGSAVSRTTYSALFSAIGTTYGTGNGSTTFNVPDLRGRVPVGADVGGARMPFHNSIGQTALGATGGEETHVLTINEIPSHNHPGSGIIVNSSAGSSTGIAPGPSSGPINGTNTGSLTIAGQGGGQAHNTVQPFQVVNWLVKT